MSDNDSSTGCIIAIGAVILLSVVGVGVAAAGLVHYKNQRKEAAEHAEREAREAKERADREAALALDSGYVTPPIFTVDSGVTGPLITGLSTVAVPVGASPVRGPTDALVTVVEFSDFQCPFCSRVHPTLEKLRADYGADIRFVWKNNPLAFHTSAEPAAQFALEAKAEQGTSGFWTAHDKMFADQSHLSQTDLVLKGVSFGVDATKVNDAITTHKYKTQIDDDMALGKTLGVSGIPAFFINGKSLTGAQPYASFKTVIDSELVKARALVASGTPRAKVYESIMSK